MTRLQWVSRDTASKAVSGSANANIIHHTVDAGFLNIQIETRGLSNQVVDARLVAGPCYQHVESNESLKFTRRAALEAAVKAATTLRDLYQELLDEDIAQNG